MKFRVGPWIYRVVVMAEEFCDEQGRVLDGRCVWRDRQILLAASLSQQLRLEVLMHELRHAWIYHFGNPTETEAHCDNVATFTVDVMRQFCRQGGEAALASLAPGDRDSSKRLKRPSVRVGQRSPPTSANLLHVRQAERGPAANPRRVARRRANPSV